jgi:hypothetical protein
MTTLLRVLRSLGPAGAVANAASLLDERRHEDRIVREVARRVGTADLEPRPVHLAA